MTAHTFLRDDATFAALLAGDLPAAGGVKIISGITRNMTGASGNVSYTGVGFQPSAIFFFGTGGGASFSIGTDDGRSYPYLPGAVWGNTGAAAIFLANPTISDTQGATVASLDADGFTLTWTKAGSPTGTGTFTAICFR